MLLSLSSISLTKFCRKRRSSETKTLVAIHSTPKRTCSLEVVFSEMRLLVSFESKNNLILINKDILT